MKLLIFDYYYLSVNQEKKVIFLKFIDDGCIQYPLIISIVKQFLVEPRFVDELSLSKLVPAKMGVIILIIDVYLCLLQQHIYVYCLW